MAKVWVRARGIEGDTAQFLACATLFEVARFFEHDLDKPTMGVVDSDEDITMVGLDRLLVDLADWSLKGDGSKDKPYVVCIQHAGLERGGQPGVGVRSGAAAGAGVLEAEVAPQRFPKFGAGPGEVAGSRFGASLNMGTGLEGLNGRPYRTERRVMVPKAWHFVKCRGFGFLKAPAFSGKTAFVQQVLNCAEAQGWRAFYFNCAELKSCGLKLDQALRDACGGTLAQLVKAAAVGDDDCKLVLALDDAQLLYNVEGSGSHNFLSTLKRLDPSKCNIRVIIAAAYGTGRSSDSQVDAPDSPDATPSDLDAPMSISIYPGEVSLQLDPEDVDELWGAWKAASKLQLHDMVKHRIAALCALQVGLMVFCFDFLSRNVVNTPADQQTQKALNLLASVAFFHDLGQVRSLRRLPGGKMLEVLRLLLWNDTVDAVQILKEKEDPTLVRKLISYGQAYVDGSGMLQLTSPLHRASLMRHFYLPGCEGMLKPGVSMLELLSRIVERLDPRVLLLTLSLGSDQRVLERCWQMEVYRACSGLLSFGAAISADVGQALGAKGFLDFYISEPYCVGLELTREGCKISEHLDRFLDPDKYAPMLDNGAIKQHAVVDFWGPPRSGATAGVPTRNLHLYTVQFGEGFRQATIWHQDGQSVVHVRGSAAGDLLSVISEAVAAAACNGPQPNTGL